MNLLYQPQSNFSEANPTDSFIEYATANLSYFAGPWHAEFISCSALVVLWPGEKLANIIQQLNNHQKQGNECANLIRAYKRIYSQLTLTEYPPRKKDTIKYSSISLKSRDEAGSFLPSTLGNAKGGHRHIF